MASFRGSHSLGKECIDVLLGRVDEQQVSTMPTGAEIKGHHVLAGAPELTLQLMEIDGKVRGAFLVYEDLWNKHPRPRTILIPCPENDPYRITCNITNSLDNGRGMFAKRAIAAGELIVAERPIILAPISFQSGSIEDPADKIEQAFEKLRKERRDEFMSLHDCYPSSYGKNKAYRIFSTNCLRVTIPYSKYLPHYAAVFPTISRCNHSCSANTTNGFDPRTFVIELRAARRIAKGEEITYGFCALTLDFASRQNSLLKVHRFRCICDVCSLPLAQRKATDARRKKIGIAVMDSTFTRNMWETLPSTRVIQVYKDVLDAIERENLQIYMYEPVRWITRAYAALGDKENLEIWTKKAMSACLRSSSYMGRNSFNDKKYWAELLKDVTRHPEWNPKQ